MDVTDPKEVLTTKKPRGIKKAVKVKKKHQEYTADEIIDIADDLLEWVKSPKNQIFEAFYKKHGISKQMWSKWRQKHEYVDQCHDIAKSAIISNLFDKTPECPSRGIFALKNLGWSDIEEVMEKASNVATFQELKAKLSGDKETTSV